MYGKYFVLFAILFTGWFLRKINFIDDKMNHGMNKLIVYFAYPCLIVHNIGSIDMTGKIIADFAAAFAASLILFFIYGAVAFGYARVRKLPKEISNVAEMAMITPNDGFMGFPIALIFFGEKGLLLMLAHNAAMNFFVFTYGMLLLKRNREEKTKTTPKSVLRALLKLLLNPNILGLFIGFAISILGGMIPEAVDEYLLYIGNISTPMAMIFIGSSLEKYKLRDILRSGLAIESSLMKLIWIPAISAGLLYFLNIDPIVKSIVVLGGCFPTAATVSMLCEQERQDIGTSSKVLFLSTVASIITIPAAINVLKILFF